ncbi:MAG: glycosyltransferase family 4 protein [Planctomycetota bacterium]|jgi:glycosyltransferase involved in cell wall biosynthesis
MKGIGRKIKIAYVSVVHPLHDHRFLYKQCRGLADNGFHVDYYVQSSEESVINNVHIKPLKSHVSRVRRFLSTFGLLPKLVKGKYDAIHLVDPELLPLGMILKLLSKPVILFDAHEDYVHFMQHKHYLNSFVSKAFSFGIKFLLYISSLMLDGFVFADKGTAEQFKKVPPDRKSFFYNFPLLSMFPDKPQNWPSRKYDVVLLGTMSRTSGIFVILEAVSIVKSRFPPLKCFFIGQVGDELKPQVDEYIQQHDLSECVEFTGRLPHGDVPNLLQQCKVGLVGLLDMPKFSRNIATKMFEYMACGIPVVSVDLPPERLFMVHGEQGYFVPPEDPQAMADAVYKIISEPELGRKMAENCREHLLKQGYYAEKEIDKLAEFYDYILAHPRRRLCGS